MENASKALIIAGTILIVMLVIGAGMFLYNRAGSLSGTVKNNWSQDEIQAFNHKFQKYEGEQKGSRVKELIAVVNKSNESSDVKVTIESFVTGDTSNGYYATAKLINSKKYNVSIKYDAGIVSEITISDLNN